MTVGSAERRAVGVVFFVNGAVTGTFASRLPWIADRLHLSSGNARPVGLTMSIGALATMPFAAQFVHRYGPKAATRVLVGASSAALALPAFAPNLAVLAAVMLLYGALIGTNDNAMNAQAVEAEQRIGKSIMSGLHGLWSLGVLAGALIGALSAHAQHRPAGSVHGVWPSAQPPAVSSPPSGSPAVAPQGAAAEVKVPRFAWPHGPLLLIGLVGFAAIFVEFAANDWSAVFMHWDLHCEPGRGGHRHRRVRRLDGGGPPVRRRAGAPRRAGRERARLRRPRHGGLRAGRRQPGRPAALAGFVLIGLGVSVVVPLVFAAAGRSGPSPAIGVAGVATVSYGAGMAAPSVMGGVADISSLRVAFGVAGLLAVAIAAGAGLLDRQSRPEPALTGPDKPAVRRRSA